MKIKAFLILASVLLAPVSTSLSAEEKITGAFGVKLGQILSSQMIKTSELAFTDEGDDTYSFSPDKKFRSFSTYMIKITPKTRKIYSISAEGKIYSDPTCEEEQALIMAIIKKKYEEVNELSSLLSGLLSWAELQIITQGNRRSVGTICRELSSDTLTIMYSDSKLAELAENERIELESSKVDSSGL